MTPSDEMISLPTMSPDELRRRTEDLREQVDDLMRGLESSTAQLQDQLERSAAIVGTGEAADGAVQADVDVQGNVLDLRIGDRAVRNLGAEQLRLALMEALKEARADATQQASGRWATLPAGSRAL